MGVLLDALIVLALALLAGLAVFALWRDKRQGCNGGCAGCLMAGKCERQKEKKDQ